MLQRAQDIVKSDVSVKRHRIYDHILGVSIGIVLVVICYFLFKAVYTITTPPSLAQPQNGSVSVTSLQISQTATLSNDPTTHSVIFYEEDDKTVYLLLTLAGTVQGSVITVERFYNGAYLDSNEEVVGTKDQTSFMFSWPVNNADSNIGTGVYLLKVYANGLLLGAGVYEVTV